MWSTDGTHHGVSHDGEKALHSLSPPDGTLLARCRRALSDESPALICPNDFNPRDAIFNADRVDEGICSVFAVRFKRSPRHHSGVKNVVAVLTETTLAQQLEQLAAPVED